MNANRLERCKTLIIKELPKVGTPLGNKNLIGRLKKHGFKEEEYWEARNALLVDGTVAKGRGRGGSIYVVGDINRSSQKTKKDKKFPKESSLYDPFSKVISEFWLKEKGLDVNTCVVEITANQGKRKTGGLWTRPDVVIVAVQSFSYIPGQNLDIITFEVKPANSIEISGVFETAAHSQFAHASYLCIHLPNREMRETADFVRLSKECDRFGIGLICFESPNEWDTYETVVEPERKNPAPVDSDKFISTQIPKKSQEQILKLLK